MSATRRGWLGWIASVWIVFQVAGGVTASVLLPTGDCTCGLSTCPMHHAQMHASGASDCHLIDPHQPAASTVAFLLGPIAPLSSQTITTAVTVAGRALPSDASATRRLASSPLTPPPR
jgi:hypothetical protein